MSDHQVENLCRSLSSLSLSWFLFTPDMLWPGWVKNVWGLRTNTMTMTMTSIFIDEMKAEPDTLTPLTSQHNTNTTYHASQAGPFIVCGEQDRRERDYSEKIILVTGGCGGLVVWWWWWPVRVIILVAGPIFWYDHTSHTTVQLTQHPVQLASQHNNYLHSWLSGSLYPSKTKCKLASHLE